MHRNTVHADLRRLATIGAIRLDCDRANTATIVLLGLLPPCGATVSAVNLSHNPCLLQQQAPCLLEQPALADPTSNPLLPAAATLEKGLKIQEKKKREQASRTSESSQARSSDQQQPSKPSSPTRPVSRAKGLLQAGVGAEPGNTADPVVLLADVLATFRRAAPREWPAPRALTLTPGRRSRLLQALAHAGSHLALQQHLQTALPSPLLQPLDQPLHPRPLAAAGAAASWPALGQEEAGDAPLRSALAPAALFRFADADPRPLRRHGGVFPSPCQRADWGLRAPAPRHWHRPLRHPRHRGRDRPRQRHPSGPWHPLPPAGRPWQPLVEHLRKLPWPQGQGALPPVAMPPGMIGMSSGSAAARACPAWMR